MGVLLGAGTMGRFLRCRYHLGSRDHNTYLHNNKKGIKGSIGIMIWGFIYDLHLQSAALAIRDASEPTKTLKDLPPELANGGIIKNDYNFCFASFRAIYKMSRDTDAAARCHQTARQRPGRLLTLP